jgi:hypothetical protein
MFVRNIPSQTDTDEDGIGDVCDNCIRTPNCEAFGPDNPYQVGDPIAYAERNLCQRDDNGDMIGDLCADAEPLPEAAGPVGLGMNDDFDQDGVTNVRDACPRQPLTERITCTVAADCGPGRDCDDGICDHLDGDDDAVGDICDSCPFTANPNQTMDGDAQMDDADGDFVGDVCETQAECVNRADPHPFSFYEVAVDGLCCTVQLVEDDMGNLFNAATQEQLLDPDGWPITTTCVEAEKPEERTCRRLPAAVENAPGVLRPPPGCEDALAAAGVTAVDNPKLGVADVGSLDGLWNRICFLPQTDQDFDGLGEPCDDCPFAYDPDNETHVDEDTGRAWPGYGKYCYGAYDPDVNCPYDDEEETGTDSGTDAGSGDSGAMTTDGSGGAMDTSGG